MSLFTLFAYMVSLPMGKERIANVSSWLQDWDNSFFL